MIKPRYTLTLAFSGCRWTSTPLLVFSLLWFEASNAANDEPPPVFSDAEKTAIASFGPWSPPRTLDKSNRVDGNLDAVKLGEALFFDRNLSGSQRVSCASCHIPALHFTDGRALGVGIKKLIRNTPAVVDLRGNRWFGWGGESDSLWSQSIRPILSPLEMGSSAQFVKRYLTAEPELRAMYETVFSQSPSNHSAEMALVNTAKALAAYQVTLTSGRSAFDDFRDSIVESDGSEMSDYPLSAQRGLKLFIGKGRCNLCHFGAAFHNGEFADIGIPFFTEDGVDAGRYKAIKLLKKNTYNLLGSHNDDQSQGSAASTRHVALQHRNWGEFKVPTLRNIVKTAPYMHNGSLATLRDVVLHYSELDEERLHSDGEKILRPLNLSAQEIDDLLAVLESLSTLVPE